MVKNTLKTNKFLQQILFKKIEEKIIASKY